MSRFVRPEVDVLKISQGDTITVKRRLNAGEQMDAFDRAAILKDDGTRVLDMSKVGVSLTIAYLVDWSIAGDDGRLVDVRDMSPESMLSALRGLEPESLTEIMDAITDHDNAVRVKRNQEKNDQGGAIASSGISPSLAPVAGDTNG